MIWCQLFSEPDAGSDAAGITTKGTRVDGGWLVNGQKVWTSGAHVASFGLATIRTNPDVPKHQGITTMVIDMHATGVEVRPLKMATGGSEFNEVFFNDVFVPDDDVIGPVDNGWTVARATLGNESVSIGGGSGGGATLPDDALVGAARRAPGAARAAVPPASARTSPINQAMGDAQHAHRSSGPCRAAAPAPRATSRSSCCPSRATRRRPSLAELVGSDTAFLEGPGAMAGGLVLWHRAMSIAGGTSEIKRNQIGERILGLPRDPLIK